MCVEVTSWKGRGFGGEGVPGCPCPRPRSAGAAAMINPEPGLALAFPGSFTAGNRRNDRAKAPAQLPRGKPRGTTPKLGVKRGNAAADASDGAAEAETCPRVYGQTDSSADVPARCPREL